MELSNKTTILILGILTVLVRYCVSASVALDDDVNEKNILDLAEKSNLTFLKLIGRALHNLRCDVQPCSDWSEWSWDELGVNEFGMKTRSRDCWYASCDKTGRKTEEKENVIFEGRCPSPYKITNNKFCLAFYAGTFNHSGAQTTCEKDGGHMINIDTKEKYEAALIYTAAVYFHVEGVRKVESGPFYDDFGRRIQDRPFFKWAVVEPHNGTSMFLIVSGSEYYDTTAITTHNVVCEIRQ